MEIRGIDKWIAPHFHKYVKSYSNRWMIFYGGAGSGKSYAITQILALKLLLLENRKLLVMRKVATTLRQSVFILFIDILSQLKAIKSINKTDMTITLNNGNTIMFLGCDDPEKIKSVVGITDVFLEEAAEFTINDISQVSLRLRSKEPYNQIWVAFNPVSKVSSCYKLWFESGTPENTIIDKSTYQDNPHLPQSYISELKQLEHTNPAYFKIYALGEFATLDRLVFPMITKKIIGTEELKGALFWVGMDFGLTLLAQVKCGELANARCAA
jgi:phage terminase large subunit